MLNGAGGRGCWPWVWWGGGVWNAMYAGVSPIVLIRRKLLMSMKYNNELWILSLFILSCIQVVIDLHIMLFSKHYYGNTVYCNWNVHCHKIITLMCINMIGHIQSSIDKFYSVSHYKLCSIAHQSCRKLDSLSPFCKRNLSILVWRQSCIFLFNATKLSDFCFF